MAAIKVKIFTSTTTKGFSSLEGKIHEWMESFEKEIEIKSIQQNAFVDSIKTDRLVISVWYKEL